MAGATLQTNPLTGKKSLLDRLTTPGGIFIVAILLIAAFPLTSAIRDPDFWWHLRAGQLLLQKGHLLGLDPFTYTAANHHWVMHEWLTEITFAALVARGGFAAVVIALTVISWLGVLAIAWRARLRQPRPFILGLGLALAVLAGYPVWGPRAQMITFAFTCLLLLLVERFMVRGGRMIWLLVPLFVLWSNLHSGFVVGPGFLAAILVAETGGRYLGLSETPPWNRIKELFLVTLACTAAGAINLNGPDILIYPFATQGSQAQQSLIQEWHSPDFHDWALLPFELMLVLLLVTVAVNRRLRARDAAIAAVGVVLSLQSVRHISIFLAATTPILIDQANLLWLRLGKWSRPRSRRLPPLPFRILVLGPVVAILLLLYAGLKLVPALVANPGSLATAEAWPVCAANYLAQAPPGLHLFNQYGEGGYLAYRLSAHGDKVFIFGDAALMGDPLLRRYQAIADASPAWDADIRQAGTDLVVFDRNTPLDVLLAHSRDWTLVYADPITTIYAPLPLNPSLHLPARPTVTPVCRQLQHQTAADIEKAS